MAKIFKPRLCGKLIIETKKFCNYFQKNLAKFKRGKHGAGLDDIDIEELDWVRDININSKVI